MRTPLLGSSGRLLATGLLATLTLNLHAASVLYVDANGTNATPPFSDWTTAATNINDAVDAATTGDTVLVTNGVYATGGKTVNGFALTNRVAVTKTLTLQSVNGPAVTIIQGYQDPVTTNGDSAARCVYLTNGAALIGFTLTNGATLATGTNTVQEQSGGGVWGESTSAAVSNCVLAANAASGAGGGVFRTTLVNCLLSNNTTGAGGGAHSSTLTGCLLIGNSASHSGGGAYWSTMTNCVVDSNWAQHSGGGVYGSTLVGCVLNNNSPTNAANMSREGGGADRSTLIGCELTANRAGESGGGASWSTLNNCTLTGNWTLGNGGGAVSSTLNNCTVYANAATFSGGGTFSATLNNCIVYDNSAADDPNYTYGDTLNYCCTTPLPTSGTNNITAEPVLASLSHLSANSPCRGAGSVLFTNGVDIDGEAWANPPSIGCDEYYSGAVTGAVAVAIQASYTNAVPDWAVQFTAQIDGRVNASRWDFPDGTVVSNQPYISHSWAVAGDYDVVLTAFNETYPDGVNATLTMHIAQSVHYVALDSTNPVPPYSSWATAATNIQDAVDAASVPRALILVSNGVYTTGGRTYSGALGLTNRVVVTKPLTLKSVNGPEVTIIQGYQMVPGPTNGDSAVRCVYLSSWTTLVGFTLANGATWDWLGSTVEQTSGGGVFAEPILDANKVNEIPSTNRTLINCVLTGNAASVGAGGAVFANLYNCALFSNVWGGASSCTLNNCVVVGNSLFGVYSSSLTNCIVYYNDWPNHFWGNGTLNYCCTTPLPSGVGNITAAPLFVDQANANFRLQATSACINSGNNAYVTTSTDLDGNPRNIGGTVDMGAYEFQSPASVLSYAWAQCYGLPTDGTADSADADGDGMNNWKEWISGTDPTNAASVFQMLMPTNSDSGLSVTWQSVATRTYFLQRATDLGAQPAFSSIQSNLVGQPITTSYTDTNAAGVGPYFYRVGVQQ